MKNNGITFIETAEELSKTNSSVIKHIQVKITKQAQQEQCP
jgi:hypothetical protein